MIYTAPEGMRAYPLLGQVEGGRALEFENFLALWNGIEPIGECHLRLKKLEYVICLVKKCVFNFYLNIKLQAINRKITIQRHSLENCFFWNIWTEDLQTFCLDSGLGAP